MQLNPESHLVRQIRNISGINLERVVAATFSSVGFTVFRNLIFDVSGAHVAEADVFASIFTPLHESRIIFECKGGRPKFNDIRNFSSLHKLLFPKPDALIILCDSKYSKSHVELANILNIRIIKKPNLVYYVLPMLSAGVDLRKERAKQLNRFLAWQLVHEYLVSKANTHPQMKQHHRFLTSRLWRIQDPAEQVTESFDTYNKKFANTSDIVAGNEGTSIQDEIYRADNDNVEAAMYIALMHRIQNVYAIMRRTLQLVQDSAPDQLIQTMGINLRKAVSRLSNRPYFFHGFPAFLQNYFYVWGGFIVDSNREWEIEKMAQESGISSQAIEHYLKVLNDIYTGPNTSMFYSWSERGLTYFKFVPAAFRALGIKHRQALDSTRYCHESFFNSCNDAYMRALERALTEIGGVEGLSY